MKEDELTSHVRQLLTTFGLYGYHNPDSRRSIPGWPDFVILGKTVLWRELKARDGQLSSAQRQVRNLLIAAGEDWDVWRPRDLLSGRIARELAGVAR